MNNLTVLYSLAKIWSDEKYHELLGQLYLESRKEIDNQDVNLIGLRCEIDRLKSYIEILEKTKLSLSDIESSQELLNYVEKTAKYQSSRKIGIIKRLRELTGCNLKHGKEFAEKMWKF